MKNLLDPDKSNARLVAKKLERSHSLGALGELEMAEIPLGAHPFSLTFVPGDSF